MSYEQICSAERASIDIGKDILKVTERTRKLHKEAKCKLLSNKTVIPKQPPPDFTALCVSQLKIRCQKEAQLKRHLFHRYLYEGQNSIKKLWQTRQQ